MTAGAAIDLLWCPFPDRVSADAAAAGLVAANLAACVHVLPAVTSHFRWEGAVQSADEVPLLAKLPAGGGAAAAAWVEAAHPYDLPVVVHWSAAASSAVAAWANGG